MQIYLFIYILLYIYPPNSQESDGGAIHRVSNYPDLLPEMRDFAVRLKFFYFVFFSFL